MDPSINIDPGDAEQAYRDKVSTITSEGKRNWLYPRKPSGRLYNARTILSYFLLGFLFAGPFIRINGQPIILMNILERKFVLFGMVFWPQDFFIFAAGMIALIVFIVLFTAIFRPAVLRLGLPADHFHGDAVPQDRILDRG
jgi:hypothetical protein